MARTLGQLADLVRRRLEHRGFIRLLAAVRSAPKDGLPCHLSFDASTIDSVAISVGDRTLCAVAHSQSRLIQQVPFP